jgi:hypothetical protein
MAKPAEQTKTVLQMIQEGTYENTLPYPHSFARRNDASRAAYRAESRRLEEKFKLDLLEEYGVKDHPKAELCFRLAWENSHAYGYQAVALHFADLVELIK